LNGGSGTRSGLAAAEWFYKAGMGFMGPGEREKALASLEEIPKIDKKHPMGIRLKARLDEGEPGNVPPKKKRGANDKP
jgi:hypothetical protein